MDFGLKGKGALVAASSQGLGKACALELCREGADVLILGRDEKTLEQAQVEIAETGQGQVFRVVADITTQTGRERIKDAADANLKSVDILVTNTGGPPPGEFEVHDLAAWESAYRLLIESAVGLVQQFLPSMKQQRSGRIIAITSQAVKQPVDGLILSNSLRASVVGLCRTLANELGQYGITVNNVMPGYTLTERLRKLAEGGYDMEAITAEIPLGRIGEPHEFAAAVCFLASERASYISGVSLPVDGGWCRGLL